MRARLAEGPFAPCCLSPPVPKSQAADSLCPVIQDARFIFSLMEEKEREDPNAPNVPDLAKGTTVVPAGRASPRDRAGCSPISLRGPVGGSETTGAAVPTLVCCNSTTWYAAMALSSDSRQGWDRVPRPRWASPRITGQGRGFVTDLYSVFLARHIQTAHPEHSRWICSDSRPVANTPRIQSWCLHIWTRTASPGRFQKLIPLPGRGEKSTVVQGFDDRAATPYPVCRPNMAQQPGWVSMGSV
ncbi:hypothetical protein H8959_007292 [Pygathrix nigripes]